MNGLNPAYVESVIKWAIAGRIRTGQAVSKPKTPERPKHVPAPNRPWRRFVVKPKKD